MQEKQVLVKKENLAVYDKANDKIFAGGLPKVTLLFGATPYSNAGAALVHFPRRVRTAWHTHPVGQNLIVTQGKIYTGTADGIVQIAHPGDVVLCPPGVKRRHGADCTKTESTSR
ncbi:cupin domain-containing protein [uncultured Campylobacter sp.]|uniref:cupin domain-containing protein n=1 Tax=uncultured Campylobacter sp. TaxID=218934 RepID=UPI002629C424|nr:cupin domain-containing protein [uncultured Campylobacter sp.]